jgi:hypothetical protein
MFKPFVGESVARDFNPGLNPARSYAVSSNVGVILGWDTGIHAIGDRAHRESALAFADAVAANPRDHRHQTSSMPTLPAKSRCRRWPNTRIGAVVQPTFIYFER